MCIGVLYIYDVTRRCQETPLMMLGLKVQGHCKFNSTRHYQGKGVWSETILYCFVLFLCVNLSGLHAEIFGGGRGQTV